MSASHRFFEGCLTIALALAGCARGAAVDRPAAPARSLGVGHIDFQVSCSPAAAQRFIDAAAILHSFWYEEAKSVFDEVIARDPSCAMGWWGVAMTLYHPIWAPPTKAELATGSAAIAKAAELGGSTPIERELIAALDVFYRDADHIPHGKRARAYSDAMRGVHDRHPADHEAAAFFALSLLGAASPTDQTLAMQIEAGSIAERVLAADPDHPGAIHYIIHAYDYPSLAPRALAAARKYARIAPSVPHALHMPSHIFTQLGLWQESIATNLKAAAAARAYAARVKMDGPWSEELHALDYMSYAYLQRADDRHAREVRDRVLELRKFKPTKNAAAYPYNAIPARFALERRHWREAAELVETGPTTFSAAVALTYFARGYGAARLGDVAAARRELAALEALQPPPADANDQHCGSPGASFEPKIEIQRRAISGWIAQLEGDAAAAERLVRSAADLEDATDDGPVTPGALVPAREVLGDLLLVQGHADQALAEFEATVRNKPGRFGARYGAARAALAAGDRGRAAAHYAKLLEGTDSTSDRLELVEARAFIADNAPSHATGNRRAAP